MLGFRSDFDFAHFLRSELDVAHFLSLLTLGLLLYPLSAVWYSIGSRHCFRHCLFARLLVCLLTGLLLCQLVCCLCALLLALALGRIRVILFS